MATISSGASALRSAVLGSYSLAWGLAGRVAKQSLSVGVAGLSGTGGPSESATPLTQMMKIVITRPTSMADFSERITNWLTIAIQNCVHL